MSNCKLREWREEDIPVLKEIRNNQALQKQLMTIPRPNSSQKVRDWLFSKSTAEDVVFFIIADKAEDNVVGFIQAVNINCLHQRAELGICIRPESQSMGYAKSAIDEISKYLVSLFSIQKLYLHVLAENSRAIEFYIKHGFLEVGRLTKHQKVDNEFNDVLIMEKFIA